MIWLMADTPPQGGGTAVTFLSLLPWLLFIVVFYWMFVAAPMRKKQKEFEKLMSGLKKGDRVLTSSGMYGVVVEISEKTIKLRIANNVVADFSKSAITELAPEETKEEKK
ncbi:MAG TPA: preprotein translocase subunit YajC [Acidobacteriota bacterium]|nr:preprotein translocase subunit YajC [Acidobacteriota bacterium]